MKAELLCCAALGQLIARRACRERLQLRDASGRCRVDGCVGCVRWHGHQRQEVVDALHLHGGMVKGVGLRATCCTAWCSVSQSVPVQGKGCFRRGMPAMASQRCRQALWVGRGHAVDVQLRQGPRLCHTAPQANGWGPANGGPAQVPGLGRSTPP